MLRGILLFISVLILSVAVIAQCTYSDCDVGTCGSTGIDAYNAATYLCNEGIVDDQNGGALNPDNAILREDLAKIIFLGLYGVSDTITTPADNFPTPYGDLSETGSLGSYHKYARVLCFLEYTNNVSVFDKNFFHFNPPHFYLSTSKICLHQYRQGEEGLGKKRFLKNFLIL